jgi:hypothetical protein
MSVKRILGFAFVLVAACAALPLLAAADTIPVDKCLTYTRYTNPSPGTCVTVEVQNMPSSPPGSSQTVKVKWSSGATSTITATPSANPWVVICNVTSITVHETDTPTSTSRVD